MVFQDRNKRISSTLVPISVVFRMMSQYCLMMLMIVSSEAGSGYQHLTIALDHNLQENLLQEYLDAIRAMTIEASELLYNATNGTVYFYQVNILVPDNWTPTSAMEAAGSMSQTEADIRVIPYKNSSLFTVASGNSCGESGQFIIIDQQSLLNSNTSTGRWLIKHWSSFRYGIFEENGYPGNQVFKTFFRDTNGESRPTSCFNNLLIWGETLDVRTGGVCTDTSVVPGIYCFYKLGPKDQAPSSIMFASDHPSVFYFCDETNERKHDMLAPTKQNAFCQGKSTWSVIQQHEDFQHNRNFTKKYAPPVFRMFYPKTSKFVFVVDVSRLNEVYLAKFRQALIPFALHWLPKNSYLSVISADQDSSELLRMTRILTTSDLHKNINKLPVRGYGSSCIACGILHAIKTMKRFGDSKGGVIVVITASLQQDSNITQISEAVVQSGVRVFTVAFDAYSGFEVLAEKTNGKAMSIPNSLKVNPHHLMDALMTTLWGNYMEPVTLKEQTSTNKDFLQGNFPLEMMPDSSERVLLLTVTYEIPGSILFLKLQSPDGNKSIIQAFYNSNNVALYRFNTSTMGEWNYFLQLRNPNQEVGISIATSSHRNSPLLIQGWISVQGRQVILGNDTVSIFLVFLRDGQYIPEAQVAAVITQPHGTTVTIPLYDNGIEPDHTAGDGIYARSIYEFVGNGLYNVRGSVTVAQSVNRLFTIGSFQVVNDNNGKDVFPPSAVLDLRQISSTLDDEITLEWTSPGDDYDRGMANQYEMLMKTQPDNTNLGYVIQSDDIIEGSLQPLAAGLTHNITVRLQVPYKSQLVYMKVYAIDDEGHRATRANLVQVFLEGAERLCSEIKDFLTDPFDCHFYYSCSAKGQMPVRMPCPQKTVVNPKANICDWPHNVPSCEGSSNQL